MPTPPNMLRARTRGTARPSWSRTNARKLGLTGTLGRATDGAEASFRFLVRGVAAHRLAEGGGGGGGVASHQLNVAAKHVHGRRPREQLLVEPQEREGLVEAAGAGEPERRDVEGRLAKIVGVASGIGRLTPRWHVAHVTWRFGPVWSCSGSVSS